MRLDAKEALWMVDDGRITGRQAAAAIRCQRRWENTPPFWVRVHVNADGRRVRIALPIWAVVMIVLALTPLFLIGARIARKRAPDKLPTGVGTLPFTLLWFFATRGRFELARVETKDANVLVSIG